MPERSTPISAQRSRGSITSLLAVIPELAHVLEPFAAENWAHRAGIPAHLTIAGPWPSALVPDPSAFAHVLGPPPHRLMFGGIGVLGDAVCLLPDPAPWLDEARAAAIEIVGAPDATDANWRPHLTLARFAPIEVDAVADVGRRLPVDLPICVVAVRLAAATLDATGVDVRYPGH